MTKRRLTRQQAWRIEKIQAERARRAKRREEAVGGDGGLGPETEGVVIAHYGGQLEVEAAADPGRGLRCHLRANLEGLVTGDRVVFRAAEPTGVVVARLPRRSLLSRPPPTSTRSPSSLPRNRRRMPTSSTATWWPRKPWAPTRCWS